MNTELEQLRERAMELLRRAQRPMLVGELAVALNVPTHRLHLAMDDAMRQRKVFLDGGSWSFVKPEIRPTFDNDQARIV
jgi:hypothetical protein